MLEEARKDRTGWPKLFLSLRTEPIALPNGQGDAVFLAPVPHDLPERVLAKSIPLVLGRESTRVV
jgi:hypothetical protein